MINSTLTRIIQTDVCEIKIDYLLKPSFKIINIYMLSNLEGHKLRCSTKSEECNAKNEILDAIESNIKNYFAKGTPLIVDTNLLLMDQISPYYRRVLEILLEKVTHGKVITYQGLAKLTGNPKASRAVGTAMSSNPFPLLLPCHRVIKSDFSLGNYGSGVKLKLYLLEKEAGKNSFKNFSLSNKKVLL